MIWEASGDGQFARPTGKATPSASIAPSNEKVTVSLVDVPVRTAVKVVLGDHLKLNFSVADGVDGRVTVQTPAPVTRAVLLELFEASLRGAGAAIVDRGTSYQIVPANTAVGDSAINVGAPGTSRVGTATQIVSLKYVRPGSLVTLVEPMLPRGMSIRLDEARNILILTGPRSEIANAVEVITTFDVDWMQGMSMAMVAVESSDPDHVAREVERALGLDRQSSLRGSARLIPNSRLRAVMVVAPQREQIDRARKLILQFDALSGQRDKRLFVYKARNRSATELADLLRSLLAASAVQAGQGRQLASNVASPTTASVAPRLTAVEMPGGGAASGAGRATSDNRQEPQTETPGQSASNSEPAPKTSVIADEAANSVLVQAYHSEYRRIKQMLEDLDAVPTQVLLEAVIAEVSLNDELKFGLKWYLGSSKSAKHKFKFSDLATGAVDPVAPGFSYLMSLTNVQVALDALSGVTQVNVVSAPAIVAMDGRKAVLQVGDQVPIVSQSAQSVAQPGAPIVNSVTMKDTGVILNVTPRVNQAGRVTLDIEQEVSSVARTTSSGIDSPTIQQRRIKTAVTVGDGETLALGGIIQRRDSVGQTQVPILGNVPLLGSLFRQKDDTRERTELVIFIRPQVIRDSSDARRVTNEFKERFSRVQPDPLPAHNPALRDATRLFR